MNNDELFPDCMVDFESTGTDPARSHLIQVAAVRFNLRERTVDHNFFDRAMSPAPGRAWDEDTRNWWLKDKREILNSIMQRMEPAKGVLQALQLFAGRDTTFWSKPTHFDFAFLESYCKQYEVGNPFHFRRATDLNSFARGRYFPDTPPDWETLIPFEGAVHNALHDTLHQIRVLFKIADDTQQRVVPSLSTERLTPFPEKVVVLTTPYDEDSQF